MSSRKYVLPCHVEYELKEIVYPMSVRVEFSVVSATKLKKSGLAELPSRFPSRMRSAAVNFGPVGISSKSASS